MIKTLKTDHIGLTVSNLEKSVDFFTQALKWSVFGGNDDYPSKYVTDGNTKLTLWEVKSASPRPFDRHANVGLHHLAFAVADIDTLNALFAKVSVWPEVVVEFAPELSGKGPKWHFMIAEPGGCRLEFCFDPR